MPVTEFATLELNKPISDAPLPELFRRLSQSQSACSGYPLYFYADVHHPSTIHLISGWADVPAHHAWIEGAENQELLKLLGPFLQITDFVHLDLSFEDLPTKHQKLVFSKREAGDDRNSEGLRVGRDVEGKKDTSYCFAPYVEGVELSNERREVKMEKIDVENVRRTD